MEQLRKEVDPAWIAIAIVQHKLYPEWIEGETDQDKTQMLELVFAAGREIGLTWPEAMQSLIFKAGYICVRAHTCRSLVKKHEGVMIAVDLTGTVKDGNLLATASSDNHGHTTTYSFDELVRQGYYDPNYVKTQGKMPISQQFPERTAVAKAVAYHYRDYHKILGIEILEEVNSYKYFDADSVQVASGAKVMNIGNSSAMNESVKAAIAEGEKKRDPGLANPLVDKRQVDLEDAIKEAQQDQAKPIPHLDMKKAMDMNYPKLKEWVIAAGFSDFAAEVEALPKKSTNKKLREAYQALELGEYDRWKAEYLAEHGDSEAPKEEPKKEEPVKTETPKVEPQKAEEVPATAKGPQLWFWNPHTDTKFIRPLAQKEELEKEYEYLGLAIKKDLAEGNRLLEAYLEKHNGKQETEPTKKVGVFYGLVAGISGATPRSTAEVFEMFTQISEFTSPEFPRQEDLFNKLTAHLDANGFQVETWLETSSLKDIEAAFEACL